MVQWNLDDNQTELCLHAPLLSYAYKMAINRSRRTTPIDLVLSIPPSEFTLDHTAAEN